MFATYEFTATIVSLSAWSADNSVIYEQLNTNDYVSSSYKENYCENKKCKFDQKHGRHLNLHKYMQDT